jgi:hypothetical protein
MLGPGSKFRLEGSALTTRSSCSVHWSKPPAQHCPRDLTSSSLIDHHSSAFPVGGIISNFVEDNVIPMVFVIELTAQLHALRVSLAHGEANSSDIRCLGPVRLKTCLRQLQAQHTVSS